MESGEYRIHCGQCSFEGRWMNSPAPEIYAPEQGCHKSAVHNGWCNACNTVTKVHTGKAGTYRLWDYRIMEEKGLFKRMFPSKEYRAALKRMKIDQKKADEFFNPGQKPRCLECSSLDVKVGTPESIPHGCGAPLQFDQRTSERGSFGQLRWSYYDDTGVVVRTEIKSIYE